MSQRAFEVREEAVKQMESDHAARQQILYKKENEFAQKQQEVEA